MVLNGLWLWQSIDELLLVLGWALPRFAIQHLCLSEDPTLSHGQPVWTRHTRLSSCRTRATDFSLCFLLIGFSIIWLVSGTHLAWYLSTLASAFSKHPIEMSYWQYLFSILDMNGTLLTCCISPRFTDNDLEELRIGRISIKPDPVNTCRHEHRQRSLF